jgi:undecaprenyl diphosphate synthase
MEAKRDLQRVPAHVAIIMDGNGRWAKEQSLPRLLGHRDGTKSVREIVKAAGEWGIKFLTLYAFSTENWQRPVLEVKGLMGLLVHTLRREVADLQKNNVRLRAMGHLEKLPIGVRRELDKSIKLLSRNSGLTLNLALNYGARQEIVDALQSIIDSGVKTVTEEEVSRRLTTADCPDPDLIIRTSGESRLSNFLLWQAAYAEIYITPTLWPDFRRSQFHDALMDYQSRHRRFGGL